MKLQGARTESRGHWRSFKLVPF